MEGSLNKRQNWKLEMIYEMGIIGFYRETLSRGAIYRIVVQIDRVQEYMPLIQGRGK